jgi:hypothetical protein
MSITILTNCRRLKYHLHDPIFANTYFAMGNTPLSPGAGFFFRMLAAKLDVR